jgi:transposase
LYVVRTGCAWRYLPADFPPWQTVYWYFKQWEQAKVTEVMLAALREQAWVQQGRNPQPSAGIIDSQSVKGADAVGRDSRGYDAGKKINGRKRFSPIRFVFADGGFAGKLVDWARTILATVVHVVRKPEGQHGFAVIPRRWCVERTLAWLTAHRRLARDYERDPATPKP